MEIGSIFEINPKCIEKAKKHEGESLCLKEVEKYGKSNTIYTASGREAISLALKSLEKDNSSIQKKCLLPAYMCDTVFFPFEQNGWELHFYHIDKNMKADADELSRLIDEIKPTVLLIHAYYGVDTWKELRPMLHEYQKSGLILMEDMTQAYYLKEVDTQIDYIVGSLRKWYSIPDGGFVTTNETLHEEFLTQDDYFVKERVQMLTDKWEYLRDRYADPMYYDKESGKEPILVEVDALNEKKAHFLAQNRRLELYLDMKKEVSNISEVSSGMLFDSLEEEYYKRRNDNYKILYHGFLNRKTVKNVFDRFYPEAAPLYLPVYAENREELQEHFRKNDIYVPVLWPIGKENESILSKDEKYIFSHILAIPMDHRYSTLEMARIISALDEYEKNIGA